MSPEQAPTRGEALRTLLAGDTCEAARHLLGAILERDFDGQTLRLRITETEAYTPDDPASHSYPGERPRNRAMFGPPGHAYVYQSYGIHWCFNIVTGPQGYGAAVLLRAGTPLDGEPRMMALRNLPPGSRTPLATGPGRLAQALAIDRFLNSTDVCRDAPLRLFIPKPALNPGELIRTTPRIGITKATDWPRRFVITDPPAAAAKPSPPPTTTRRPLP